jgi:hypothetical protein
MKESDTQGKEQRLQSAFKAKLDDLPPHVLEPLRTSYREGVPPTHLAPGYRDELVEVLKGYR